jgi:hypothetical protein
MDELERTAEACYDAWRRHMDRMDPLTYRFGVGQSIPRPRWLSLASAEQEVWRRVAAAAMMVRA